MNHILSKFAFAGIFAVIGISLLGCHPGMSDQSPTSDPRCDNTAPLNSCGSFMPQNNESLGK